MSSRPDSTNEPASCSRMHSEIRLLLVVVAVTACLALGVSHLRSMASGRALVVVAALQGQDSSGLQAASSEGLYGSRPLQTAAATGDRPPATEIVRSDVVTLIPGDASPAATAASDAAADSLTAADADALSRGSGPEKRVPWPAAGGVVGIAHRGASAELPEHTRAAYELAVAEGADFIECDVVLTRDLVPLCRHEPNLVNSTDVATKFPDRWRNYNIDGEEVYGIFSVDLTAEEVATLRAVQPWPFRNQSYNGQFKVATLTDFLDVALSANRIVGIYPETKHPTWTNSLHMVRTANTTIEDILLAALTAAGFGAALGSEAWLRRPVFLQSFEAGSLRYLTAHTCAPAVLLMGDWEGWVAPDSGLTLAQLVEESSLEEISQWATAVGLAKGTLVQWQSEGAGAEAEAGQSRGGTRRLAGAPAGGAGGGRYISSGLVELFHAHGLQVHTYTLRPEPRFFLPHLRPDSGGGGGSAAAVNVSAEYELLLGPGEAVAVDGLFTDHMPSLRDWLAHRNDSSSLSDRSSSSSSTTIDNTSSRWRRQQLGYRGT